MKMPPAEKILEAYSAIADKRIIMHENSAEVSSSDGTKTYTVEWDGNTYASSDPATYWQGYPGYPVLAVLMKQGKLPLDEEAVASMAHIPWKKLNDALGNVENKEEIMRLAQEGNALLAEMDLVLKRKLKKK